MKRRRLDTRSVLDASYLAWGGAIDGRASVDTWPWTEFNERDDELFDAGHVFEKLAVTAREATRVSPRAVDLEIRFEALATVRDPPLLLTAL